MTCRYRVQAHPEFTSKVLHPSPAILGFVAAGAGCLDAMIGAAAKRKMANGNTDGFSF